MLQVVYKERVRRVDHLVKPDLFPQKRMRCILDDRQLGRDTELIHLSAKRSCMRTGIIRFPCQERAGWVILIEVIQRRC